MQRTIQLPDEQARELEQLAAHEHRSVDLLVQFAVGDYLARRHQDWSDWSRRWNELTAEIQSRMPPGITPQQIEADITANFEEYLAERTTERRANASSGDAGRR